MPAFTENSILERKAFVTERIKESLSVATASRRGREMLLQYKLIETTDSSAIGRPELNYCETVFSLLIIKSTADRFGTYDETVFIYDISRSKEAAEKLLSFMSKNGVSPEHAKDVIDDIL